MKWINDLKLRNAIITLLCALLAWLLLHFYHYPIRHVLYSAGFRITRDNLPLLVSAVAWPTVVALAAFLFRVPIREFLAKMTVKLTVGDKTAVISSTWPGTGEKETEAKTPVPPQPPAVGGVTFAENIKNKPANVFWVGSDILGLFDALVRGGPRAAILNLFRQSNHHMKVVGLKDTSVHKRFMRLYDEAQASLESDWTNDRRVRDARELISIRDEIAALINAAQPGFTGDAKTTDPL